MTQATPNGSPSQSGYLAASTTPTLSHNHAGGNFLTIKIKAVDGSLRTVSGVTYGGAACTRITNACGSYSQSGVTNMIEEWRIANPATGAQNIVATFSAAVIAEITAQSWSDVDTTSPTASENFVFANVSTPAPSVTLSPTADDQVIAGVMSSDTNATGDVTVTVGTQIGSSQRDAVYSATASGDARNGSGGTITFGLTNSSAYGMSYYLLKGTASGGGGSLAVERVIWMN